MSPRPRLTWNAATDPPLRDAAGLVLLYPEQDELWLPLTLRAATLPHHTGQVSLPGGRLHAGESAEDGALREAEEEVGIIPSDVTVLGRLTPLPIPVSRHLLHPVVGFAARRPRFTPAAAEVERLLETPLSSLRRPDAVQWHRRPSRHTEHMMDVPHFDVHGSVVWGATAMILAELLALLDEIA